MIDCFMFFNELDLLEIRLNSLVPYVGKIVLCESVVTHSGKPKPLFFKENKERFKDFNIVHLIADDGKVGNAGKNKGDSWCRENYQREFLMQAVKDALPDEVILLSDVDEIPNLKNYDGQSEGVFRQRTYGYYLNTFSGNRRWKGTIATKRKNIITLNILRDNRNRLPIIVQNGGWHFSSIGDINDLIYKVESFAHTECNTDEFKQNIEERRRLLLDPFGRARFNLTIEEPIGFDWLLKNKHRYPHLWYNENN